MYKGIDSWVALSNWSCTAAWSHLSSCMLTRLGSSPRNLEGHLDAFDASCLWRIQDLGWYHRVSNARLWQLTAQPPVSAMTRARGLQLFWPHHHHLLEEDVRGLGLSYITAWRMAQNCMASRKRMFALIFQWSTSRWTNELFNPHRNQCENDPLWF